MKPIRSNIRILKARMRRRVTLGVIALETDKGIERDLTSIQPDEAEIVIARCPTYERLDPRLAAIEIGTAAHRIARSAPVSAIAYACTSGSFLFGPDTIRRSIAASAPEVPSTNVVDALSAAMDGAGISRLSLLTPYDERLTERLAGRLRSLGVSVDTTCALQCRGDMEIASVSPRRLRGKTIELLSESAAPVVFLACNALQSSGIISEVQRRTGRIVLTSNQVLMRSLMSQIRRTEPEHGADLLPRRA